MIIIHARPLHPLPPGPFAPDSWPSCPSKRTARNTNTQNSFIESHPSSQRTTGRSFSRIVHPDTGARGYGLGAPAQKLKVRLPQGERNMM